MFIEQPTKWLRWIYPKALWRMDPNEKAVYLTFDDGPSPFSTTFILDTLKKIEAKATFFMVGDNVQKYPELYHRILNEKHGVGNHTFNHIKGATTTIRKYSNNVKLADDLLHTKLFRPPYGWMRLDQYAWLSRKYKIVMWDVVTRDYSKWMTPESIINNVKTYTRNGSIITFHDSIKTLYKLYYALPESLQWLKDQGYSFKLFSDTDTQTEEYIP